MLKDIRKKLLNMTQIQFANEIGVSQQQVSNWEKRNNCISLKTLERVINKFGLILKIEKEDLYIEINHEH